MRTLLKTSLLTAIVLSPALASAKPATAAPTNQGQSQKDEDPAPKLDLHPRAGPAKIDPGHNLTIDLPESFVFFDEKDAKKLLAANGPQMNQNLIGVVTKNDDSNWFVTIRYEDDGYVKDDDAAKLNADEILQSIKEGTEEANKYRREHGAEELQVLGWAEPPAYQKPVHHLTWAIKGKTTTSEVVNVNTRLLGRKGYASLNLVAAPEELAQARPEVATLLKSTTFKNGSRYEDFDEHHDKVAEYGLAALVAGGAGAFALKAAKIGLIAKFWNVILAFLLAAKKAIVLALAGGVAAVKKFFGRKPAETATTEREPPTAA